MKTEELKEKGLTDEQIKFVMAESGKEINALKKEVSDLTEERDKYKSQAEEAEKTLKNFDGVDVEKLKKDIADYQKKAEDLEKDYNDKIYQRDFDDALNKEMAELEFTSDAAKKSVAKEVRDAGLKLVKGKILGFGDLISQIKESDASAFVDKQKQKLEAEQPKFTGSMGQGGGGSTVTKESIMAIKDRSERRKAMSEHMDLFEGGN